MKNIPCQAIFPLKVHQLKGKNIIKQQGGSSSCSSSEWTSKMMISNSTGGDNNILLLWNIYKESSRALP